jgi:thiol-disulfide isomerase/thioredoxin
MERLLGHNVINNEDVTKRIEDAMKGKSLVMLYFSASWCPPCKAFTPILSKFYEKCCKPKGVEIVFISSDQDKKSFTEYFGKMPWLALPFEGSDAVKKNLSGIFQVQGIPHLVVLDAKTTHFVAYDAKEVIASIGDDVTKGNELIAYWKAKEAVPIERAQLSEKKSLFGRIIAYFLRNPMNMVALVFFAKSAMKKLKEMMPDEAIENEL